MHLLLVEDDDSIAIPLITGLEREGFEVTRTATGKAALEAPAVDLILLDLGLPDLDGNEVCRQLRARSQTPIIVVSARGDEIDRVILLELGADDYVVKPFGFRELVARIRAVARRGGASDSNTKAETDTFKSGAQEIGSLQINRRTRQAYMKGSIIALTPKEFDLLAFLAEDPGAVCSRTAIIESVWDAHWWGPTKTLDVHVASLRKKLGNAAWVETARGVGFRLGNPPTEDASP